ncbi:MAG: 2-phosphosulfolactate phosphatase [Thermaerobacter sp.]|nr:2-phosphosulfolactate phosphatase [Thermaerobacter sp.]
MSDLGVLVIDTLRATTTMATMLEHGAEAVLPVADLSAAYRMKEQDPALLLAGERHNVPPSGFDGGNSPFDYPPERVSGRRIIFTTTNGTQAIDRAQAAKWVGCAALVNAAASAQAQQAAALNGLIICAGTRGRLSLDDVLAGGAVAAHWPEATWTDAARMAVMAYERYRGHLPEGLREARHGQQLMRLGLQRDIDWCGNLDILTTVPTRQMTGWFTA